MQVLAREPVGSGESDDAIPDLAFLAFQAFEFGFAGGKLHQIGFHQSGDGRVPFGCGDPGAPVSLIVH